EGSVERQGRVTFRGGDAGLVLVPGRWLVVPLLEDAAGLVADDDEGDAVVLHHVVEGAGEAAGAVVLDVPGDQVAGGFGQQVRVAHERLFEGGDGVTAREVARQRGGDRDKQRYAQHGLGVQRPRRAREPVGENQVKAGVPAAHATPV